MPRLVIRKGPGTGRDLALGGECVVGRHPTVTFPLEDTLASRRHFRIYQQSGAWVLEDLGSTNGTKVNGRPALRQPLLDGDLIQVGQTEMEFVQKDLLGAVRPGRQQGATPPAVAVPPAVVPPAAVPPAPSEPEQPTAPVPRRRRRYR